MTDFKLGVSAAASWAWGTSLIVGMEIAQTKGLAAWTVWAIANAATLAVFGALAGAGILSRHVYDRKPVKAAALLIQIFCLVIQLNIINKVMVQMGASSAAGYLAATGIGVVFTLWMYRRGLATSIKTDNWQGLLTFAAITAILAVGVFTDAPRVVFPASTGSDILWGVWSACILLSGPIGDVQHWQRAERGAKAYYWGAAFFAFYMLLILAMAGMEFNPAMNAILLLAVICVTSSTIDSIAVALHETVNKRVGTILALFICVFWGVFAKFGVIELWSKAGVYRVGFALAILALALLTMRGNDDDDDET